MFTILHVSDVHFGVSDERGEQSHITGVLIDAAKKEEWKPDLCVFSGDLTFKASESEFKTGAEWLTKLVEPWNSKLFIVPGNHDVDRSNPSLVLRQAYESEQAYAQRRDDLRAQLRHLDGFQRWHQGSARSTFGDRLLSDWTDLLGCCTRIETNDPRIRLVGLNTALLSCANDDFQKLAQDIPAVNRLLNKDADELECIIAIGHHPLSWLVEWNRNEVGQLLGQERGAHLYLHGHQHEQSATAFASALGQSLATLECGAAYQGSRWPQYFALYRLDFERREIATRVFPYSPNAGEWVFDGSRSRTVVVSIPQPRARKPSPTDRVGASGPQLTPQPIASAGWRADDAGPFLEPYAYRAVARAENAKRLVESYIDDRFFDGSEYSRHGRVKRRDRIVEKVLRRRRDGLHHFQVEDLTDVCGFRYVSLYQSSVPLIVERLLQAIPPRGPRESPFCCEGGIEIEVHTSRQPEDPLSIVDSVQEVVNRVDSSLRAEVRPSRTGYSSVHLVIRCRIEEPGEAAYVFPVEFQVRSILEEVWGQLDHKLRYQSGRGAVGERWHRHLNVLKGHLDALIPYIDLIKAHSEEKIAPPPEVTETRRTIEPPQRELQRLREAGLPNPPLRQVEDAYELWKQADASQQFGGKPGLYREAADAFLPFVKGSPDVVKDTSVSQRLAYTARLERAYLLMYTNDSRELAESRTIYEQIIDEWPNDATAPYRLGQVLRRQTHLEEAIERFEEAIRKIESNDDWRLRPYEGWVYDFARLDLGLTHFRRFEKAGSTDLREAAIGKAIEYTDRVLAQHTEPKARWHAANNLLYYACEERRFRSNRARWMISDDNFRSLIVDLDSPEWAASYEQFDTLARAYDLLGDRPKAVAFANRVCEWLEVAAVRRSDGLVSLNEGQRTFQQVGRMMEYLINDDERDALLFALDLLEKSPDAKDDSGRVPSTGTP
jgi:ppGpp synthetase/RelA/SpoT-type nucleotidyltranferase/3',5'-cyclic AMP phosphodiesterase CpdA